MGNEIYTSVAEALREIINKAQYFGPLFSWLAIVYTYYAIGYKKGKIWKCLLYISTIGYIASFINVLYTIADAINYKYDTFIKFLWIEGFLWSINEWGYIYINYIKIRTYIKRLRTKKWSIFIYTVLFYVLFVRFFLCSVDYKEKRRLHYKWGNDQDKEKYDKKSNLYNSLMYFPLGIACVCFIFFIIEEFHNETNKYNHNVISSLLDSTLSRMLFVSLIFLGMSIIVAFPNEGFVAWVRRFLWRTKGYLGIIILSDLLLLRLDLNDNNIIMKNERIEKMKQINTPLLNHRKFSMNNNYNNIFEVHQANSIFSDNMSYHEPNNNNNSNNNYNYNYNYNFNYSNMISPEVGQRNYKLIKDSESIKSNSRERRKSSISNISERRKSSISNISGRRKNSYPFINTNNLIGNDNDDDNGNINYNNDSIYNNSSLGRGKKRISKSSFTSPIFSRNSYGSNSFNYNKLESPIANTPTSKINSPSIEIEKRIPGNIALGPSFSSYQYNK
ncbi:hypothetical protein BCR32DRAFT_294042 [Anaeromyces robustus]|uniref:Uncharacterized protein n=1 Tax=Anaeromyces robustus TaxID=1754192 RepID=A0A1Y1X2P5_9FUNG|nr:hypothetical protein BCR32DRAFT_294042 [Anaeromyces robustus]|eukprot:ORX80071.1 hypothetical protein BCR32DRAFT_294042 [Anaeromyces robustus]